MHFVAKGRRPTIRLPKTSRRSRFILAGVAGATLVNWVVAKSSERRHPPMGHFVTTGGTRLHYLDLGPRTAASPPVVLLHGNGATAHDFIDSGLVKILARERRVIVFDRPGSGYSERPRTTVWTVRAQARLLADALVELGVDRPVVLGHSFGALVALALALEPRPPIAGLVLLSGYYFPSLRPEVPLMLAQALPIVGDLYRYTLAPLMGWIFSGSSIRKTFAPSPVPRSFASSPVALSLRPSQLRAIGADTALMVPGAAALCGHYADIRCKVAIVAGTADQIVDVAQAKRLHDVIENSELHLVPGEGHMVHHLHPLLAAAAIDSVGAGNAPNGGPALSIARALRIRERAHAAWCESGEPTNAAARFQEQAATEVQEEELAYDKTVADSFPASDPPANSGFTHP